MSFEPQKFFIGLIDFFSVLLPGALLTYVLKDQVSNVLFGSDDWVTGPAEGWIVFLFGSYLVGHFVFLIGSVTLDDQLYDRVRNATFTRQVQRLAAGKTLSPKITRWFAERLIGNTADIALHRAIEIKERYLKPLHASSAVNAFQWSKSHLALTNPEALTTVQRFEADSKFFRSLVVVLCVLIPWYLTQDQPVGTVVLVGLILLILALWRYIDQRVKSVNQAYWFILALEASDPSVPLQTHELNNDCVTHAGGVVFRKSGSEFYYLLVQASTNAGTWVLPKGHIERGERPEETAVREVAEEGGIWGRVTADLGQMSLGDNSSPTAVQFFLLEQQGRIKSAENRGCRWLNIYDAIKEATFEETKEILRRAKRVQGA